jgi:hypothetical protein
MTQTDGTLDPAFVFDPADPQTFWDNYAYFQAEAQRKHQEGVEQVLVDAAAWLKAEAAHKKWAKK